MTPYTLAELFGPEGRNPSLEAVALKAGIEADLLRRFTTGEKYPTPEMYAKIENAIHAIGRDMLDIELVTPEHKLGFEGLLKRAANTPPMPHKKRK